MPRKKTKSSTNAARGKRVKSTKQAHDDAVVVPPPWNEFIGMFEHEKAARDVEKIIAKNRDKWIRVL
jgi:hypothetical protein